MKDGIVIFIFALVGAERTTSMVGSIKHFPLWAKFLIFCFIVAIAIVTGFFGSFFTEITKLLKEKWIGKKNGAGNLSQPHRHC